MASEKAGSWRMLGTLTAVSSSYKAAAVDLGMVVGAFEMVVDPLDTIEGSWDATEGSWNTATLGKAGSPDTAGMTASFEASRSME